MSSILRGVTIDAPDAHAVALFWAAALGRDLVPGASPEHAELTDDPEGGPRVVVQAATGSAFSPGPLHLDLVTADLDAESERLSRLGARRLGSVRVGASHGNRQRVTLVDPVGNVFDLVAVA
ncbi:MAG TPA: VOC family protein [Cellulomonas sp.]